jgi:hypothetical protein
MLDRLQTWEVVGLNMRPLKASSEGSLIGMDRCP